MAYIVSEEGIITMFKGDRADLEIALGVVDAAGVPNGEYVMQPGDTLTMTVRKLPSPESEIEFSVVSDTNVITILPEHTANVKPGRYSADIQLTSGDYESTVFPLLRNLTDKQRSGVVPWNNFILAPEVTN